MANSPAPGVRVHYDNNGEISRVNDTRITGTTPSGETRVQQYAVNSYVNGEYYLTSLGPVRSGEIVRAKDPGPGLLPVDPNGIMRQDYIDNKKYVNRDIATDTQKILEGNTDFQSAKKTAQQVGSTSAEILAVENEIVSETGRRNDELESNSLGNRIDTENYKVRIISNITGASVKFNITPVVDESRSAQYDVISPTHHPGTIQRYKTTSSRSINVNGRLFARTAEEAAEIIKYMNLIRSWVMPYYGSGTLNNNETGRLIGAPPDTLKLNAYGEMHLHDVPVVLASYAWTFPDDIDYIPAPIESTPGGPVTIVPCPRIIDVTLTFMENYSPEEFSKFDIASYRKGDLSSAYNGGIKKNYSSTNASKLK